MIVNLCWQDKYFLPSVHGLTKNYSFYPDVKTLALLKQLAYSNNPGINWLADKIIRATLSSGVCSGLSVYSLLYFTDNLHQYDIDKEMLISIFQSRTWGKPFVYHCVRSYSMNKSVILEQLKKGLVSNSVNNLPLIVLLPRVKNLMQISNAHTIVPYCLKIGLTKVEIKVYDSNYPGNDGMGLTLNKLTERWSYIDKDSENWVMTINYLSNLTKKVPVIF